MKKRLLAIIAMATITSMSMTELVFATDITSQVKSKSEIIEQIANDTNGKEEIFIKEDNGVQLFIDGEIDLDTNVSKDKVLSYLEKNRALFGFKSEDIDFGIDKCKTDELGFTHVKLNQTFKGKEIYGRKITVHFDENGNIQSMTGTLEDRIESVTKKNELPISGGEAIKIAKASKEFTELTQEPKAENYIYYKDGQAYDVYKVNVVYDLPTSGSWEIFVDLYSGDIIEEKSLIREASVTGTGRAVNGSLRNLNLYEYQNYYYMQDATKPMRGYINTFTANNSYTGNAYFVAGNTSNINDPAAVSAHSYAEVVYDFYKTMFNRDSIDDNGMTINSIVHFGSNYNNAYWDGYKMVYGDGDGRTFTSLSGDLDVVAHEMTHGVTSYTCDLNYENQSDALNETLSDVFGVLIQTYDKYNVKNGGYWEFNPSDWVVGDEIYTPGVQGDALRSLANPTLYNQPAHMNNYINLPNTKDGDYGGVHINSGITNKAAYNLASYVGCEKTAKIFYRAMTTYFNNTTSFAEAKLGLIKSAKDLYGNNSREAQAVDTAFSNVGIN